MLMEKRIELFLSHYIDDPFEMAEEIRTVLEQGLGLKRVSYRPLAQKGPNRGEDSFQYRIIIERYEKE